MQIAFWSEETSNCGITGNIIAIAYMSAIQYAFRAFIMQSKYSCPTLDFALIPQNKRISIHEEYSYFHESGLDAILSNLFYGKQTEDTIESTETKQKKFVLDHALELKSNLL
ncbi:MAG: hypothetical protein GX913_03435 [Clostridiales bacterium]|nr:hypothetical protein [Clostridiales bacterium]